MKRYTDTDEEKDPWFRQLSPALRCVWRFLRNDCDNSGVWKEDVDVLRFYVSKELSKEQIFSAFNNGKKRIIEFAPQKWFITGFVVFQFGYLPLQILPNGTWELIPNPDKERQNPLHLSVVACLNKYFNTPKLQALVRPCLGRTMDLFPSFFSFSKNRPKVGPNMGLLRPIGKGKGKGKGKGEGKKGDSKGGAAPYPGDPCKHPDVNRAVALWREKVGPDPSLTAARLWIAKRLGLCKGVSGQQVPIAPLDDLLAAVERYAADITRSKVPVQCRYKARNFFSRRNTEGHWGYVEDYLDPDNFPTLHISKDDVVPPDPLVPYVPYDPMVPYVPYDPTNEKIWNQALDVLRENMDPENFATWIQTIKFRALEGDTLHLDAPSHFNRSWLQRNFSEKISTVLYAVSGRLLELDYHVVPQEEES
jgi:hypothetical protein